MDNWLDDWFKQKQTWEDRKRSKQEREQIDAARVQALLPSFWKSIIEALSSDVQRYNDRVEHEGQLHFKSIDADKFLIERQMQPPVARLVVAINTTVARISCEATYLKWYPNREFKIRLKDDDLYLENQEGKVVPTQEFPCEVLKGFFSECLHRT